LPPGLFAAIHPGFRLTSGGVIAIGVNFGFRGRGAVRQRRVLVVTLLGHQLTEQVVHQSRIQSAGSGDGTLSLSAFHSVTSVVGKVVRPWASTTATPTERSSVFRPSDEVPLSIGMSKPGGPRHRRSPLQNASRHIRPGHRGSWCGFRTRRPRASYLRSHLIPGFPWSSHFPCVGRPLAEGPALVVIFRLSRVLSVKERKRTAAPSRPASTVLTVDPVALSAPRRRPWSLVSKAVCQAPLPRRSWKSFGKRISRPRPAR
jgi:hypothetical protein